MTPPAARPSNTDATREEQASLAVGRAAGYCWVRNPKARGRCTWPPEHAGKHKDHYAGTEWS